MEFTDRERAILRLAQGDLPRSLTPYADMAQACGCTESEVLGLLERLRATGAIRRFGASLRHQAAGWGANAMVAWLVEREEADKWAHVATSHPQISHVYYRPSQAPDWPYSLYTMIHGKTPEDCAQVVDWLRKNWPFSCYQTLDTLRELKKISMTYFT